MSFGLSFILRFRRSALWAATLFTLSLQAQTTDLMTLPVLPPGTNGVPQPALNVLVESAYTGRGETSFQGTDARKSDAFSASVSLSSRVDLDTDWQVPLGLSTHHVFLDAVPGLPVPEDIHTLQLSAGLSYRLSEQWLLMGRVSPTLYKFEDIGGNDFGASGTLTAVWSYRPTLKFLFGLMVSPDSDLEILPLAGLDWNINDQYTLRLVYPRPRLIYRWDERLSLHVGANIHSVTFRTDDQLGTDIGLPAYDDALATYRDIRLAAGAGYALNPALRLEGEIGYSVNRRIEYTRWDESVRFDPAPYVRLSLMMRF